MFLRRSDFSLVSSAVSEGRERWVEYLRICASWIGLRGLEDLEGAAEVGLNSSVVGSALTLYESSCWETFNSSVPALGGEE